MGKGARVKSGEVMGARRGTRADARIGWVFIVFIAAIAMPFTAMAIEPVGGDTHILYFEPLHTLTPQSGVGLHKTSAEAQQLSFDAYGRRFALSLEANDRLIGQQKTGVSSLQLYRGTIDGDPQSWVRLAVSRDEVHGMLWDGANLYVIEPAADVLDALVPPLTADSSDTVIFRLADVLIDSGAASCASDSSTRASKGDEAFDSLVQELKNSPVVMQATGASKRITVSALGDFLFLQRYPNEQAARDALLTRLNNVDGIFSSQLGIEIRADAVFVNSASTDALSATTSANGLLNELGKLRKRTPELNSRGLTHLFTGRDLDGTTIGIAYLDSLCHAEHSSGLTEAQSPWRDSLVAAHEMGHTFGADHDGDPDGSCAGTSAGYLMGPNISGNDTFSQCSVNRMRARAQAASCITNLPPANISIPSDLGIKRHAVTSPFDWQLEVANGGGLAARNVHAELLVPPVVQIDDMYVAGGSCTSGAGVIQCNLGDVPGSTSRVIHLVLHSEVLGSNSISAHLTSNNDASNGNNEGDGTLVIEPEADLAVTLQGPSAAKTSEMFSLALSVMNRADVGATNIDVSVELPDGITASNATLGGVGCTYESGRIRCSLPSLAPGATATGSMSINVAMAGDALLRARVSGNYVDPDSSNDVADLTVNVSTSAKPASQSSASSDGGGGGGGGSTGVLFLLGLAGMGCTRRRLFSR
jgi:hypothetical protein